MAENQRVYFVIDAKSFYASVEAAERGLDPMTARLVVADESRTDKTICLAVSPALKKLGVKNRCRLFDVPKEYQVIVAKPRMKKYIEYAATIYGIYLKYIAKEDIHVYSIDESIIDVTSYLKLYKMRAYEFAEKLMNEINEKTRIPTTCGIGTNMYLAKVALGISAKHTKGRIAWLDEEKFKKTLWNHQPLTDFWGISAGISSHLGRLGIYDMQGIATADEDLLYKEFGVNAEILIDHANGIEPVTMSDIKNYAGKSKSISSGQVFGSGRTKKEGRLLFGEMVEALCLTMAKSHLVSNLLMVNVRFSNHAPIHFSSRTANCTNLSKYLLPDALNAYDSFMPEDAMIRGFYLAFSEAIDEDKEYYDLFTDLDDVAKEKAVRDSVLELGSRYGKNSVLLAHDYCEGATTRERNKLIGGHNGGEN